MVQADVDSSEFSVAEAFRSDRSGPVRWILSHQLRHKRYVVGFLVGSLAMVVLNTSVPTLTGRGFDVVLGGGDRSGRLTGVAIALLVVVLLRGLTDMIARMSTAVLAQRMDREARDELYVSLLGKSQTFHNRQRVGDLMARAANDVKQLNAMILPGVDLVVDSMLQGIVPLVFIGLLDWRLLLSPGLLAVGFVITVRRYMRQLGPVSTRMREQFGDLNAGLNEAVRGIEVVKVTAQEPQEQRRFTRNARLYRDSFVAQGVVQARYLPTLLLALATAGALLHGLYLHAHGQLTIGQLVAYLGQMSMLGFPMQMSSFTFSLLQLGVASAGRLLALMSERTELDHNPTGHTARLRGEIRFEDVGFGYTDRPVLRELSFTVEPGQTVAIVGETGAGKTTLTHLVNRINDVGSGRVLIDGVDVRDWSLDSLRSQISTIEQDVMLFSRSVAENIAFSRGQRADREAVRAAARGAQAEEFIEALPEGYDTVIGERGVTLSGGQRQRLAIARALLTDPGILILDDSTSAVDSATEDEIQQAIKAVQRGRTTLLITHRLSQIRWADQVVLLQHGRLVDVGSHDELLARCRLYRRIFSHYDEVTGDIGAAEFVGRANPVDAVRTGEEA